MWGFKVFQWVCYLLLFAFLLFALGGESAWQGVLNQPGGASLLRLFLSFTHTLFSSKGLAALGSYALMNLFLGFCFYRRYRKRLLRSAEKRMATLKAALTKIWKACLEDISKDLQNFREEIHSRRSAISDLSQGGQGR
jgi:hypothetical protein